MANCLVGVSPILQAWLAAVWLRGDGLGPVCDMQPCVFCRSQACITPCWADVLGWACVTTRRRTGDQPPEGLEGVGEG